AVGAPKGGGAGAGGAPRGAPSPNCFFQPRPPPAPPRPPPRAPRGPPAGGRLHRNPGRGRPPLSSVSVMIEAVVFDLDGVIVDSEPVWEQVRRQVVAEHGGHWLPDAQTRPRGMRTRELARDLRPYPRRGAPPPA